MLLLGLGMGVGVVRGGSEAWWWEEVGSVGYDIPSLRPEGQAGGDCCGCGEFEGLLRGGHCGVLWSARGIDGGPSQGCSPRRSDWLIALCANILTVS